MIASRRWLVVCCVTLLGACMSTDQVGDNCSNAGQRCPPPGGGPPDAGRNGFDQLDLLLVVDNTSSMELVQSRLAQQLPELVRALLSGDVNADGTGEFNPVVDLQFAVVSSDMGAPGLVGIPGCGAAVGREFGDDGIFLNAASANVVRGVTCGASPPFLSFDGSLTPTSTPEQAGCRAFVGIDGCSYPMPLEAAFKALWNSDDPADPNRITFLGGVGHGINTQPGFVRDGALLGVIVVTDDDDCSMAALSQIDSSQRFEYRRCLGAADRVQKLSRYRTGFGALKGGQLDQVFFGVIAGVPTDLAAELSDVGVPDKRQQLYYKLLEDERMQQAPEAMPPEGTTDLRKSCGEAYPPRRLVELAARLDGQSAIGSICDDDLSVPVRVMTTALARLIDPDSTF